MASHEFDHIKGEVAEIVKQVPGISADNAFVVWFLRAFFTDDQEEAVYALTGGANDRGIDAIHLDDEARTVYVAQGKYYKGDKVPTEDRSDLTSFADFAGLLSGPAEPFKAIVANAHPGLQERLKQSRTKVVQGGYRVGLLYATTGRVSKGLVDELEKKIAKDDGATLQIFDRASLIGLLDDYIEGAAPPVPRLRLPVLDNNCFRRYDPVTKTNSWIFSMSGREVGKLYKIAGRRLFARNIRGYLGQTKINRNMQATLAKSPELFWYFNNGVTIICDSVAEEPFGPSTYLTVTSPQVIKGQQTTRALAEHSGDGASVLVKLICVKRDTSVGQQHFGALVGQIVSATNYQNAIRLSDLKANDGEQVRIERELRKWGVLYIRKVQSEREISSHLGSKYKLKIKKEELAAATAGCLLDPATLRLGKENLFDDENYKKIFNGRPALEYLVHHSLWKAIRRRVQFTEQGYAIWLCLGFLWGQIGARIKGPAIASWFFTKMRSPNSNQEDLRYLNAAIDEIIAAVMAFYRKNRRGESGLLDATSFFKRSRLDGEFKQFWHSKENLKRAGKFDQKIQNFFEVAHEQI